MYQIKFILLSLCLLNSQLAHARDLMFYGKSFSPENISFEIKNKGVFLVNNTIQQSPILQAELNNAIRAGESRWLDLFIILRQHPEAEWGGLLDWSLAYAIEKNPNNTLTVIKNYHEKYNNYFVENLLPPYAELICGNVDEDWALGCSLDGEVLVIGEQSHNTLEKRKKALESIDDPGLLYVKDVCVKKVNQTIGFWRRFIKSY